jgi:hypothetical protein
MATAALVSELAAPTTAAPSPAIAWWRRWHSYAFMALIVGEVFLTWGFVRLVEYERFFPPGLGLVISAALFGFVFAQTFLLGLWAALGGLATVPRWLLVGAVATAGGLAIATELLSPEWTEFLNQGPVFVLLAVLITASFAAILLPLRRLAGWRVDFDAAYHPNRGNRRGQMQLMDFAALLCAVALPLTLCRALIELMGEEAVGLALFMPIFGGLALASAAPAALAVLVERRRWLCRACCACWLVAICAAQIVLTAYIPDFDVFDARSGVYELVGIVAAFHGGAALTVALPLALLRLAGLKLIVVA